jgi:pimeloyl-ACP methyl ester carboxylesterase
LAPFATFVKAGLGFLLGFIPFLIPTRTTSRFFERKLCYRSDFGFKEHSEILYERFRSAKVMFKVRPRVFTDEELQKLDMPTLLLIGEQESLYNSRAAVERARRVLPNGDVELIPNCNHAIVSDQTERVRSRVIGFLNN